MKSRSICLIAVSLILLLSCSEQRIIELPLKQYSGYGHFNSSLGGISTYSEEEDNLWKKTYLAVTGAPKDWSDIKFGDIETNIYQSVYQNYLLGNFSKETYEELQRSWDWKPDTLQLSKEPLKTKIAFAYGKDPAGVLKLIVDANNNLDLSDDKSFIPYSFSMGEKVNRETAGINNTITVSYERLTGNKKQSVTVPLFIAYISEINMFMCNFPHYCTAELKGEKIAVCSGGFTDLSYKNPTIFLMNDTIKNGDKISNDRLTGLNEYIEIKGEFYKNKGVNMNSNTLRLEKVVVPRNQLYSTQIGYKPFPFEGSNFTTGTPISSKQLNGKYVLLDFWAVWCKPCREELPKLKALYEKTDRQKFEIIGIVAESDPETLKKLIVKDSITWTQILSNDSNKIKETFGIQGYPTTLLVDPEGIIIAKNLRGKELEEKVLGLIREGKPLKGTPLKN
jgi:thiol-disulfide isomerase/thioredoxin